MSSSSDSTPPTAVVQESYFEDEDSSILSGSPATTAAIGSDQGLNPSTRPTTTLSLATTPEHSFQSEEGVPGEEEIPELSISSSSQDVTMMLNEVLSGSGNLPPRQPELPLNTSSRDESDGEDDVDAFLAHSKQYFVLSRAGKPIYSLHGSDELVSGYTGIFQTIVSFFGDSDDKSQPQLRSFKAGKTLFVVSIEGPLILAAVDKLGHSEAQLRSQLGVLYAQILSTLTKSQIAKVFEQRTNFDLRQLLGGTEVFLKALTDEMKKGSPAIMLGALECLRLRKSTREKINNVLIDCRTSSLLYGMIVADGRLVSVIRPRRHSLHPPDLYLVFSMLFNTTSFKDGGEHWAPICLPKFNSTGFLYAYIHFFEEDIALVLISPDKNAFFELRQAKDKILQQLEDKSLTEVIQQSVRRGRFKCMDVPAPLVRHFLYKSKMNVQFVQSSFEPHFYEAGAKQRLMNMYHQLHGTVHAANRHGGGTLRLFNCVRQNVTALAWVTPTFELYCVTGSPTTKEAVSQSVRQIVSWVKQQEQRLFVVGGAVF